MARVTVEDCLEFVDTNYELVLKAASRARDLADGAPPLVDEDNDKPIVIALREIAEDVKPEDVLVTEGDDMASEFLLDQDPNAEPLDITID